MITMMIMSWTKNQIANLSVGIYSNHHVDDGHNHYYRTPKKELDHADGCPAWAECCTEYGFCHPKVFSLQMNRGTMMALKITRETNHDYDNTGLLGSGTFQGLQRRKQRNATSARFKKKIIMRPNICIFIRNNCC